MAAGGGRRSGIGRRIWRPVEEAIREQQAFVASPDGGRLDVEVVAVLLSTALVLTIQYYALVEGGPEWLVRLVARWLPPESSRRWLQWSGSSANEQLILHGYWGLGQIGVYTLVPCAVISWLGRPWREYGVRWRGAFRGAWIYGILFLVMLPVLYGASLRPAFRETYPYYRLQLGEPWWPRLVVWELIYAGQFVALEFFFRGYLLHGTRRRFGPYAILVMTVPYCMIHYGKPIPETWGAVAAGVVLGYLCLKTGTIWLGAALHIAVAWTMDVMALR